MVYRDASWSVGWWIGRALYAAARMFCLCVDCRAIRRRYEFHRYYVVDGVHPSPPPRTSLPGPGVRRSG